MQLDLDHLEMDDMVCLINFNVSKILKKASNL